MGEVTDAIAAAANNFYTYFLSLLPEWAQKFIGLFLLVLVIVVYAIFVWKFYKIVSKKNIVTLNLKKYNRSPHPTISKITGFGAYVFEYIIFMPLLIFIAFGLFTIFLILLTQDISVSTILVLSATIIGAIRMTAYYKEEVSQEIAKLLPFTLIAVSMTKSNFFNFERILSQISQLPQFFNNIITYLLFIIILESVLRFFEFLFGLFGLTSIEEEIEQNKESLFS